MSEEHLPVIFILYHNWSICQALCVPIWNFCIFPFGKLRLYPNVIFTIRRYTIPMNFTFLWHCLCEWGQVSIGSPKWIILGEPNRHVFTRMHFIVPSCIFMAEFKCMVCQPHIVLFGLPCPYSARMIGKCLLV